MDRLYRILCRRTSISAHKTGISWFCTVVTWMPLNLGGRRQTESHSQVWWLLWASETVWEALTRPPVTEKGGTSETTDVPAVGKQSRTQGLDPEASASQSGVWVRDVTLTWLHGWAGAAWWGFASWNQILLPAGERRGGRVCRDCVPCTAVLALLRTGDIENCSFKSLGTAGRRASGGTTQTGNKIFSTRPFTRGRSELTISSRAGSKVSGSPILETPLAPTLRPLWRLLLGPGWSGDGDNRSAPSAMSRRRGCSRRRGDDSRSPPEQDVSDHLCLLLCSGEL